ncbi:hypothetical protein C2G38_2170500 [Gigaspora rosea]|uniref:Uncharacterized protein n=1 Tax=Gigaspora rosea TaxID=44941 RepID=A0A397VP08_9GLOM|nr:hypothetical protein C2G38_2170500 [Gigaspora rosea]
MLIRTLTLEQIEEIQEIINKNFSRAINDKQLPEALEFILEAGSKKEVKELTIIELTKKILKVKEYYQDGLKVKVDENKIYNWHIMLAKLDNANGTFIISNCYLNGKDSNRHLEEKISQKTIRRSLRIVDKKEPLDNLEEIKSIDISALEKEENKVKKLPEDQELTYHS